MKRTIAILLLVLMLTAAGCVFAPDKQTDSGTPEPSAPAEETYAPTPSPVPTAVPTEAPTPVPTAEPSATPLVTAQYKCRVNDLNLRSAPDINSSVIAQIHYEDRISVIGPENDQFLKAIYDGQICYCYTNYLVPANEELYGYLPPMYEYAKDAQGNIIYEDDGVTPVTLTSELIDVRLLIPDIEVYQIFGTDKNFTGKVLYERPVPVLQVPTARKLAEAAKRFRRDGYTLKLYDSYRPKSVQFILYDIVQNSAYIANPYNSASNHNRAAAVDITLIGPDGKELEFPTPMHTFTKRVYRTSRDEWTPEQQRNVDYMTNVMLESGFKLINTEWWHFSDVDYPSFIVMDINMKDIPRYTASQLGFDTP